MREHADYLPVAKTLTFLKADFQLPLPIRCAQVARFGRGEPPLYIGTFTLHDPSNPANKTAAEDGDASVPLGGKLLLEYTGRYCPPNLIHRTQWGNFLFGSSPPGVIVIRQSKTS